MTTLGDAVRALEPGSVVYLGNFGAQLFAVGHELIRQRVSGLRVIVPSGGILLDQLVGASVTTSITLSHCWNPVGPSPAYNFRRAAESGRLDLQELSFGALSAALTAGAWGVPFLPTTDLRRTDYATRERTGGMLAEAHSPFGSTAVVKALVPDVAFIHADTATTKGDAWLGQPRADCIPAAQAARRTVIVAEELVNHALRHRPADIPGLLVSDVVLRPGAVQPDGASGRYPRDIRTYRAYAEASKTEVGFAEWLDRLIAAGVDDG